ncbi:MAG: hypothetical protein AB2801_18075 [Candidatus Thiodiazotropha endolucinida]
MTEEELKGLVVYTFWQKGTGRIVKLFERNKFELEEVKNKEELSKELAYWEEQVELAREKAQLRNQKRLSV